MKYLGICFSFLFLDWLYIRNPSHMTWRSYSISDSKKGRYPSLDIGPRLTDVILLLDECCPNKLGNSSYLLGKSYYLGLRENAAERKKAARIRCDTSRFGNIVGRMRSEAKLLHFRFTRVQLPSVTRKPPEISFEIHEKIGV